MFPASSTDKYYQVISDLGVTNVLLTNHPENYGYSLIDRVTVLVKKFAVHIIGRPETVEYLLPIANQIGQSLLNEAFMRCTNNCQIELDEFSGTSPDINLEIIYIGLIRSLDQNNCHSCRQITSENL